VLYLFTFTVILIIDSSTYLSVIQSPTSSLSGSPVAMLLDGNWQYAFFVLSLHPTFTLCKGKSSSGGGSSSGKCWKIYGWLGLGLFIGVLVLVVFCACPTARDCRRRRTDQIAGGRRTWYSDDRGGIAMTGGGSDDSGV
jgi:hypothetical protein